MGEREGAGKHTKTSARAKADQVKLCPFFLMSSLLLLICITSPYKHRGTSHQETTEHLANSLEGNNKSSYFFFSTSEFVHVIPLFSFLPGAERSNLHAVFGRSNNFCPTEMDKKERKEKKWRLKTGRDLNFSLVFHARVIFVRAHVISR